MFQSDVVQTGPGRGDLLLPKRARVRTLIVVRRMHKAVHPGQQHSQAARLPVGVAMGAPHAWSTTTSCSCFRDGPVFMLGHYMRGGTLWVVWHTTPTTYPPRALTQTYQVCPQSHDSSVRTLVRMGSSGTGVLNAVDQPKWPISSTVAMHRKVFKESKLVGPCRCPMHMRISRPKAPCRRLPIFEYHVILSCCLESSMARRAWKRGNSCRCAKRILRAGLYST